MNLLHWWLGCHKFNLRHPHWRKVGGDYPRCGICGRTAVYMWGYKHFKPDEVAQRVQGAKISDADKYWSQRDGYT